MDTKHEQENQLGNNTALKNPRDDCEGCNRKYLVSKFLKKAFDFDGKNWKKICRKRPERHTKKGTGNMTRRSEHLLTPYWKCSVWCARRALSIPSIEDHSNHICRPFLVTKNGVSKLVRYNPPLPSVIDFRQAASAYSTIQEARSYQYHDSIYTLILAEQT